MTFLQPRYIARVSCSSVVRKNKIGSNDDTPYIQHKYNARYKFNQSFEFFDARYPDSYFRPKI